MGRITIRDIARLSGVSVTTVSRALNDDPEIRAETRERVLRVCRETGYRANLLARSLSSSRSHVLGVILPDISNPFYAVLSLHIESCAKARGYQIMLCRGHPDDRNDNTEELISYLIGQQVDGILLPNSSSRATALLARYDRAIPSVLIGSAPPEDLGIRVNSVSNDNYMGAQMAAEYLHRLGHRDVVYLGARPGSYTHALRHAGFLAVAKRLRMRVESIPSPLHASTIAQGRSMAAALLRRPMTQTAIFCAADMLALGVMEVADELGLDIPGDFSLMGYDNIDYSALPKIRLTTVAQPFADLAREGVEMLVAQIKRGESGTYVRRLITPTLVERATCAPPPARD